MIKLKRIESILKRKKTIITLQAEGCQWLSDGNAFYPVSGLPLLDKDNIFTIFDVPVEKREGFYFAQVNSGQFDLNFADVDATERLTALSNAYLIYQGRTLSPQSTAQGLELLDARYLQPFYGMEDGFDVYVRTNAAGKSYFAIKAGFLLLGIIVPVSVDLEPLIRTLNGWSAMGQLALENERESMKQDVYQQGLLDTEEREGGTV